MLQNQLETDDTDDFRCSITRLIMVDPVSTNDGHSYEREAIENWLFTENKNTSPYTGAKLQNKEITPNITLKKLLNTFLDKNRHLFEEDEVYLPKSFIVECLNALKKGNEKKVLILINRDIRLLIRPLDQVSLTAIHMACQYGPASLILKLFERLDNKADLISAMPLPQLWEPSYLTKAAFIAAKEGNAKFLAFALSLKFDLKEIDKWGKTVAHYTVENNHIAATELLLARWDNIHEYLSEGALVPLLYSAISNGHEAIIKLLITEGADKNESYTDKSFLHHAIIKNNPSMIDLFLDNIKPEDIGYERGWSPLMEAARCGNINVVASLLDKSFAIVESGHSIRGRYRRPMNYYHNALHKAIRNGHSAIVMLLLEKGAELSMQTDEGSSTLHFAAAGGHIDLINLCLEAGININSKNENGSTPLHWASENGRLEAIKFLLAKGADILAEDCTGKTPLMRAVGNNCTTAVLKLFIDVDIRVLTRNSHGKTALHYVLSPAVTTYLLENGIELNSADEEGNTPLHLAVKENRFVIIQLLIKAGADIAHQNNDQRTVLHLASRNDDAKTMTLLLEQSGSPLINAKDKDGNTTLHISVEYQITNIVHVLLEHGADITSLNNDQDTPLHLAVKYESKWKKKYKKEYEDKIVDKIEKIIVLILAQENCPVNVKDKEGNTALHTAAKSGRPNIVQVLLEQGADVTSLNNDQATPLHLAIGLPLVRLILAQENCPVNAKDKYGNTALHIATKNKRTNIAQALLAEEADVTSLNNDQETPLHWAVKYESEEIFELLITQENCPINVKDINGNTALHTAIKKGNKKIVECLLEHGAEVKSINNQGETPLFNLDEVNLSNMEVILKLLLTKNTTFETMNKEGLTVLHKIVISKRSDSIDRFKLLLNKKDIIEITDKEKKTILHPAADKALLPLVKFLLEKGANPRAVDKNKWTPMHYAARARSTLIVQALHTAGAQLDAKASLDRTPFYLASFNDALELMAFFVQQYKAKSLEMGDALSGATKGAKKKAMQYLLEQGVNVNCRDISGHTPLYHAAINGNQEIVEFLLEKGAEAEPKILFAVLPKKNKEISLHLLEKASNLNSQDEQGDALLHLVIRHKLRASMAFLIDSSVNLEIKNQKGQTPLMLAVQLKNLKFIKSLVKKGANINAQDNENESVLHYASRSEDKAIIKYLLELGIYPNAKNKANKIAAEVGSATTNQYIQSFLEQIHYNYSYAMPGKIIALEKTVLHQTDLLKQQADLIREMSNQMQAMRGQIHEISLQLRSKSEETDTKKNTSSELDNASTAENLNNFSFLNKK